MPKRSDIDTVVLLGAGPIVIGQACEFDYSGTQACKTLKEEGYRVVLINSNPATIMTDPELADVTYIEPLTASSVQAVIEQETHKRPTDRIALLSTMGGQVALNVSIDLSDSGFLDRHDIELLGARPEVIRKAEDRELFRDAMEKIDIECARSVHVSSLEEGVEALKQTGLPAILRPSFTLGGTGGGIANTQEEFIDLLRTGLEASPVNKVLVEESLLGWKEYELEVVRDRTNNSIIICSIENIDPMGIHTGDSITVAPALTLTDKEYQLMRDRAIACVCEIGVDTGGSNVQFAVNPANGRQILIEMNPRVSRSSALASKATGFPIARVAAKLAIGYTLDEITNEITGTTPASFEPSIDYVVTKIPRFDFDKFPAAKPLLTTAMRSVGEVMAIGRDFAQSMQKALRSLEIGLSGFDEIEHELADEQLLESLRARSPMRILRIAQALRQGIEAGDIHTATGIDPWFIAQIGAIVTREANIHRDPVRFIEDRFELLAAKKLGLSDARIGQLIGHGEDEVSTLRRQMGIEPVIKKIDTCAAEFRSQTSFMYSSYEGDGANKAECECDPSNRNKIVVLGSGPNRIGQGIEFDYCCVHACYGLAEIGFETIMINCNPETVSTDYDTSDRLYFEPLTREDVLEILRKEQAQGRLVGVIVQLGGQTPLKLAKAIEEAGIPVLGTSTDSIDLCEDRDRFKAIVEQLGLTQPRNDIANSAAESLAAARRIGYPVVIRPSYVLGGQAMRIVEDDEELKAYINSAVRVSNERPVLIDGYLRDAIECDVDALCDRDGEVLVTSVLEHVEPAGVHSGDSACVTPPYSLSQQIVEKLEAQTVKLAKALNVEGLMNVQYAIKDDRVYLIEVNPRASRTVPFVAKARGIPYAKMAAQLMAGKTLAAMTIPDTGAHTHIAVKEAVLPFKRFAGSDTLLGPEMKSTGEVMGIENDVASAFAKAQEAAGFRLDRPGKALVLSATEAAGKTQKLFSELADKGIDILVSKEFRDSAAGLDCPACVDSPQQIGNHRDIRLVLDPGACKTPGSRQFRHYALAHNLPYFTTQRSCELAVQAVQGERRLYEFRPNLQSFTA